MGERNKRTKLKKSMGPGSIWAVAVGSIIGWGCFIQGGLWTERAGGPLPLFLGFLAGGLLMIVVGYSYSYMIAKFPVAGGEFAYAYKGFGRTASYICGWMLSLGYLSIVALNATALPVLASYIFPGVFNRGYLYTIAGYDVYMGEVGLSLSFRDHELQRCEICRKSSACDGPYHVCSGCCISHWCDRNRTF